MGWSLHGERGVDWSLHGVNWSLHGMSWSLLGENWSLHGMRWVNNPLHGVRGMNITIVSKTISLNYMYIVD